ncbi:MAG: hypothetical protein GX263_01710 [Firmicutes bacterium]|nr:hypothetical protein [Bacillota bacterium]
MRVRPPSGKRARRVVEPREFPVVLLLGKPQLVYLRRLGFFGGAARCSSFPGSRRQV